MNELENQSNGFGDIARGFFGTVLGAAGSLANTAAGAFGARLTERLTPTAVTVAQPNPGLSANARQNEQAASAQDDGVTLSNNQILIAGGVAAASLALVILLSRG